MLTVKLDATPSGPSMPPPPSPPNFMPDALSAATLPIYHGLEKALNITVFNVVFLSLVAMTLASSAKIIPE